MYTHIRIYVYMYMLGAGVRARPRGYGGAERQGGRPLLTSGMKQGLL